MKSNALASRTAGPQHEGKLLVHLTGNGDPLAGLAAPIQFRQEIERDVGIAAQAQLVVIVCRPSGDQLGDHIDAPVKQVAGDMRVVGARVRLLGERDVESASGGKIEFVHRDVLRQAPFPGSQIVSEFRIVAGEPLEERSQETALQLRPAARPAEGQCGIDLQLDGGIACGPFVERIDDRIGLAEAQGQPKNDVLADLGQDGLGTRLGLGVPLR